MDHLMDIIRSRRSVRTFDGNRLRDEDRIKLEKYIADLSNPFDIPVDFIILDAEEHGLSSPVLSGEKTYVTGIVKKGEYADVAYGFSFEKLVLYAWSMGIGTVWIGGTMKREVFEAASGLKDGYMMPCVSPLGYPAKKKSIKETMMRKGVSADHRMPPDKLFFRGSFDEPFASGEDVSELLEMVRWAPSAVNKQPWRIVVCGDKYHFYEKKDKGYVSEKTGDLQKIDIGIALCHFVMGMEEQGKAPVVTVNDPGINTPGNTEYIATVQG